MRLLLFSALLSGTAHAGEPPRDAAEPPAEPAEHELDLDLVLEKKEVTRGGPWDGGGFCTVSGGLQGKPVVQVRGRDVIAEGEDGKPVRVAHLGPEETTWLGRRPFPFSWSDAGFEWRSGLLKTRRRGTILGEGRAIVGSEFSGKQYRYRGSCAPHQIAAGVVAVWFEQQLL